MNPFSTDQADVVVRDSGFVSLPSGVNITWLPLWDARYRVFARLGHGPAADVLERMGMRLPTVDEYAELHAMAVHIDPFFLPLPEMITAAGVPKPWRDASGADSHAMATYRAENMRSLAWAELHDDEVMRLLDVAGWAGRPVANAGKHWATHNDVAVLTGWWDASGKPLQVASKFHLSEPEYTDYATTVHGAYGPGSDMPPPILSPSSDPPPDTEPAPTIHIEMVRIGDRGPIVEWVQRIVAATADGIFGPGTKRRVKVWQSAHGLVGDGIFGRKSWSAAGYDMPAPQPSQRDPRAPACIAALRDADARWPSRKRQSDGIMGDPRHQAGKSDHNRGDAIDITHDPDSGCTGDVISELAIADARTTYVIWNRRIYNRARAAEGWRKYSGSNGHTHHCHISVRVDARDDDQPWAWA